MSKSDWLHLSTTFSLIKITISTVSMAWKISYTFNLKAGKRYATEVIVSMPTRMAPVLTGIGSNSSKTGLAEGDGIEQKSSGFLSPSTYEVNLQKVGGIAHYVRRWKNCSIFWCNRVVGRLCFGCCCSFCCGGSEFNSVDGEGFCCDQFDILQEWGEAWSRFLGAGDFVCASRQWWKILV